MPDPIKDEEKDDFISRCMGDAQMQQEYPDGEQLAAVCYAKWEKKDYSYNEDEEDDKPSSDEVKFESIDLQPTDTMAKEAERGLAWREEYNRGGTEVGVARARDIKNRANLSPDTVNRMVSYFARHEVDKQGQGWSPGEDGYPSAGRIAWALWGGDPGRAWAEEKVGMMKKEMTRASFARIAGAEIFAEGSWNGLTFSESDLDGIVDSFNALGLSGRVPLKLGHSGPDARANPESQYAMGWVERIYRDGKKLMADLDLPEKVSALIKDGMLKFVSVELLQDVKASTRKIPWVLDAVALLGSDQPAVGILKDLQSLTMTRQFEFGAMKQFVRADRQDFSTILESQKMSNDMTELAREVESLRAQVQQDRISFHRKAIKEIIESAVAEEKILPSARERFYRTHKIDTPAVLEVDDQAVAEFIRENPNPDQAKKKATSFAVISRSTDAAPEDMQADTEALQRAQAFCREQGWDARDVSKLNAAVREIFTANADLGKRYKLLPDEVASR